MPPPPVLHPLKPHTSHLVPSVHKNSTLEVFYIDPLGHLSVQAVCVQASNLHGEVHIHPSIMVMICMKFQDRLVLIVRVLVAEML